MFSFQEDQKAQMGPFEGEKNAKAWGVPSLLSLHIYVYYILYLDYRVKSGFIIFFLVCAKCVHFPWTLQAVCSVYY